MRKVGSILYCCSLQESNVLAYMSVILFGVGGYPIVTITHTALGDRYPLLNMGPRYLPFFPYPLGHGT